ncbi:MAG: FtsX-like permease family protein [Bdellovibrionota bacterium]
MSPFVSIGVRNVLLHWRHSLAAVLAVAAAFFSINVFQGYLDDLEHLYLISFRNRSMYGDILITHAQSESEEAKANPSLYDIGSEAQDAIRKFAGDHSDAIETVSRALVVQGTITNGQTSAIFVGIGTDLIEGAKIRGPVWAWNALYGEPLDLHPEGGRVLLGQALGHTMDCWPDQVVRAAIASGGYKPEVRKFTCSNPSVQLSTLTESGQLSALDLEVGGLSDAGYVEIDKKFVWMSLQDAQSLQQTDHVTLAAIALKENSSAAEVTRLFREEVGPRFPMLLAGRWQDHPRISALYNQTMDFLRIFRNFVAIVIIVMSTLSVVNTLTKSLSERTQEIGTLLSLGFRPWHIRSIFLVESVLLCFVGVLIGGVATVICASVVNSVGIFYKGGMLTEPIPFRIMLGVPLGAATCVGLLMLGVFATLIACERVLAKKIVDCLRHA